MHHAVVRSAYALFIATSVVACAEAACVRRLEVEVCGALAEDRCVQPTAGFAAGIGYQLRVRGLGSRHRALNLSVHEISDAAGSPGSAAGDGQAHPPVRVEVAPEASELVRPIVFPEVGVFRVEVRSDDGHLLGEQRVDVSVSTVTPRAHRLNEGRRPAP